MRAPLQDRTGFLGMVDKKSLPAAAAAAGEDSFLAVAEDSVIFRQVSLSYSSSPRLGHVLHLLCLVFSCSCCSCCSMQVEV